VIKGHKSIYFRNFLTTLSILILCFAIMGSAFLALSYRFVMREKKAAMITNAQEVARLISAYAYEWDLGSFEVRMALSGIAGLSGYHILLCDPDGAVVSCSDRQLDCEHIGKTVSSGTLGMAGRESEEISLTSLDGLYTEPRYAIAMRMVDSKTQETAGYIVMSAEKASMNELWREFSGIYLSVAVSVMAIALIISIITSKKTARPLREMAAAAGKFAKGDFSARVSEPEREDEIRELADAFNLMAESLERSENQRRELIANVSHELKTPMTTIAGFSDGLLDGTIPPERQDHYLRLISSETKRMSRMVRSMLDLSKMQEIEPEKLKSGSFDAAELICLTLGSLEKRITDRGLDVSATLPEEAVLVRGDSDAITRVMYNLLDNAAKFSPAGHVIRVELWKKNGKAYVSVENDGETISPEELPLIFDRFHKTDRSRSLDKEGVGLGLYIVKTILDAHGEDIYVTSENGVTKFVFTLTLKED